MSHYQRFEVKQNAFDQSRIAEVAQQSLADGEVRLSIDFFAFTANNLTYAVAGDVLGYWQFFPVADDPEWGVIPVWGFAEVTESRHDEVKVGNRLYGYFPPAEQLVMRPDQVSGGTLFDASEHRQALPPLYNRYQRVTPGAREAEALQALLGPLFMTSYCLWDQLAQNDWYGAEQIVLLSASSKTSLGLAKALAEDDRAPELVGMTSAGNVDFLEGLGWYDRVMSYDELASLPERGTVVVDMAGNASTADAIRAKFGERIAYYISVGITHWEDAEADLSAKGDKHEFFFAPGYMLERISGGASDFIQKSQAFVFEAAASSGTWLEVVDTPGLDALAGRYAEVCEGRVSPAQGLVFSLAS